MKLQGARHKGRGISISSTEPGLPAEHGATGEAAGALSPGEPVELAWDNANGGIVPLSLFNFVLRIATLGIYHFWGKTEVRKRIWSSVRLQGEPLEYTGTGKELFLGFVVVFFVVMLPLALASFAAQLLITSTALSASLMALIYVAIFVLIGMGTYRAQGYRMSRTRWRGIRGSLTPGKSFKYAMVYIGTALLIPLTIGWIVPWRSTVLQKFVTNNMKFGNRPMRFTATSGPLYKRFWAVWLTPIIAYTAGIAAFVWIFKDRIALWAGDGDPTKLNLGNIAFSYSDYAVMGLIAVGAFLLFALVQAWYTAGLINYFASQTWYGRARFKGNATATSLVWLTLTNTLITILSLGALAPLAQSRFMNYYVSRLEIDGTIPLERVGQNEEQLQTRGEGLASAFDIDAFG